MKKVVLRQNFDKVIHNQDDFNRALEKITYLQGLIEKEEEKISDYFDRHPEALHGELE